MKPIDSLTPEELRVEIAESLGWKDLTQDGSVGTSPQGQGRWTPPNWSRDANAALTLADALRTQGWRVKIHSEENSKIWEVTFISRLMAKTAWADDEALPIAICRAYLTAIRFTDTKGGNE